MSSLTRRELYVSSTVAKHWKADRPGCDHQQSHHGSSGKQARSIVDGLEADVATLAQRRYRWRCTLMAAGFKDWQKRLPRNNSPSPPTSRAEVKSQGNQGHQGLDDLVRRA